MSNQQGKQQTIKIRKEVKKNILENIKKYNMGGNCKPGTGPWFKLGSESLKGSRYR